MGYWPDGLRTPFWWVGLAAGAVVIFWFVAHSIRIVSPVSPRGSCMSRRINRENLHEFES